METVIIVLIPVLSYALPLITRRYIWNEVSRLFTYGFFLGVIFCHPACSVPRQWYDARGAGLRWSDSKRIFKGLALNNFNLSSVIDIILSGNVDASG